MTYSDGANTKIRARTRMYVLDMCCYYVHRSLTFAASQLASLILGDARNQVTYTTSYLPMSTLIEWIRNRNTFSDTVCETTTVVSVTDGFSVSNSSFIICIEIRSWQIYAHTLFSRFTSSSGSDIS